MHLHEVQQLPPLKVHAPVSYILAMTIEAERSRKFPFGIDLNKILPDLTQVKNEGNEAWHTISQHIQVNGPKAQGKKIMLLINVFIKKLLMEKVKNTNFTQISNALFLRLTFN